LTAFGFVLITVVFGYTTWSDVKSGANYYDLSIRNSSRNVAVSKIEIKVTSPWGTETKLIRNGEAIWHVPRNEKRLASKVIVTFLEPTLPAVDGFEYLLEGKRNSLWLPTKLKGTNHNGQTFELILPTQSSNLFPSYGTTINWKGDLTLLLRTGIGAIYTLTLLLFTAALVIQGRNAIAVGVRTGYIELKPRPVELIIGCLLLGIFVLLNSRNADLATVMYRQFDELTILRGIESLDFVYGTFFNLTALPFIVPGLIADNFSWAIIGGRLQSAVSMLFLALIFRRILAQYFQGVQLNLLSFFPFLVPYFWIMGTLFHPDAQMTALLLGCCYFLIRDNGTLGGYFHMACFFLSASLAAKLHALMFAPLIPLYLLMTSNQRRFGVIIKSGTTAFLVLIVTYILLEPRILSLSYLLGVIESFQLQLWTNKTGFDLTPANFVPIKDKLTTIDMLYSPMILNAVLAMVCSFVLIKQCISRSVPLAFWYVAIVLVITYYALFLNKDWSYYYVSPFFLFIGLAFIQFSIFSNNHGGRFAMILGVLIAQPLLTWNSWKLVVQDFFMPEQRKMQELSDSNDSLIDLFRDSNQDHSFLLSYGIPFDYRSLEIEDRRISYLNLDGFKAIKHSDFSFLEGRGIDFVLINLQPAWEPALTLQLRKKLPSLGFTCIFQDSSVEVYRSLASTK
jgi:hypothetical protein